MAKKKRSRLSKHKFFLSSFFLLLFFIYCYLPLAVKLKRINGLIKNTEKEIIELEKDNSFLKKEEERLKTDMNYIERIAKENLDLIRPGETLYKIAKKRSRGGAAR